MGEGSVLTGRWFRGTSTCPRKSSRVCEEENKELVLFAEMYLHRLAKRLSLALGHAGNYPTDTGGPRKPRQEGMGL